MRRLTPAKITALELKAFVVESKIDETILYAIHNQGEGISVIDGTKEIVIAAEIVREFAQELMEIWDTFGKPNMRGEMRDE